MTTKIKLCILAVFVATLLASTFYIIEFGHAQVALPGIRIRSDGSITPDSVPIQRSENTYTLTADIYTQGISIEKEGIVIDGAGYSLIGPYHGEQTMWIIGNGPNQAVTNETFSMGIDTVTNNIGGLAIKNLNVKNFTIGMYIWTKNNMISGNAFRDCTVGILLSGNDNNITKNYIAYNKNGIYFGSNQPGNTPTGVVLSGNSFDHNLVQLSGCVCSDFNINETKHTWDNGALGNFWSDYNGTDSNFDGIGDTPYVVDPLNWDRYPLMESSAVSPIPAAKMQVEIIIITLATAVAIIVTTLVIFKRNKGTKKGNASQENLLTNNSLPNDSFSRID